MLILQYVIVALVTEGIFILYLIPTILLYFGSTRPKTAHKKGKKMSLITAQKNKKDVTYTQHNTVSNLTHVIILQQFITLI